jgi:hypothetical protein
MAHHAFAKASPNQVRNLTASPEPLCGANHLSAKTRRLQRTTKSNGAVSGESNPASANYTPDSQATSKQTVAAMTMDSSCARDCGCCAQASIRNKRPRELAVFTSAQRPLEPSSFRTAFTFNRRVSESGSLRCSIRPRAPPTLLS